MIDEVNKGEGMKLAIVYPDRDGWTVDQFKEAAHKRNVSVQTISLTDETLATRAFDEQLGGVDAVLWKFADATTAAFLATYPILKDKPFINTGVALMPSTTDKFLQQQFLARSSIAEYAVPTYRVDSVGHVERLVAEGLLQYPIIIKPSWGTNSRGVYVITHPDKLATVASWRGQIAEPFIASTEEWRVFVVGGVAAGIMRKHRRESANPRTTIIGGGARNVAEEDKPTTDAVSDIAERVAALFHLEYAGVDVVRDMTTGKFYVYEANSAAGWQNGFIEATGEDIPGQVLDWFEERLLVQNDMVEGMRAYLARRAHRLSCIESALVLAYLESTGFDSRSGQYLESNKGEVRRSVREILHRSDMKGLRNVLEMIEVVGVSRIRPILEGTAWLASACRVIDDYERVDEDSIAVRGLIEQLFSVGVSARVTASLGEVTVRNFTSWVQYLRFAEDDEYDRVVARVEMIAFHESLNLPLVALLDLMCIIRGRGAVSSLESVVMSRARASMSWAGNFLIDGIEQGVGVSTAHTMRQGYRCTLAYLRLVYLGASTSSLA